MGVCPCTPTASHALDLAVTGLACQGLGVSEQTQQALSMPAHLSCSLGLPRRAPFQVLPHMRTGAYADGDGKKKNKKKKKSLAAAEDGAEAALPEIFVEPTAAAAEDAADPFKSSKKKKKKSGVPDIIEVPEVPVATVALAGESTEKKKKKKKKSVAEA